MKYRTYHQVTDPDHSGLGEQVARQRRRVRTRLDRINHVVAVVSGKGGVGKSYVTAGLALALAEHHTKDVGVLDADFGGPTTARMLDAAGPLVVDGDAVAPAIGRQGVRVMSTDLLLAEGSPVRWSGQGPDRFAWRGTLEAGTLREFLADVAWGALDVLMVDLPPGAVRLEDLAEFVPTLSGAVVVTIPSDESRRAVARAMRSAAEASVPLLGVIENMCGIACDTCRARIPLFSGEAGQRLATEFGVPLLGSIPFLSGGPSAAVGPEIAKAFLEVLP